MKAAAERRCNEALWFNTDLRLAEGSVCNVFIIEGESLITPPLDTPVLPGVTRAKIIEIAKANDVVVSEEEIIIERLLAATEVFLTGSVLQVMPVTAIEKHIVGKGTPGELTKRMADWYQAEIERESAGHAPWEKPSLFKEYTDDYPKPIVDHAEARDAALKMFKDAKG